MRKIYLGMQRQGERQVLVCLDPENEKVKYGEIALRKHILVAEMRATDEGLHADLSR